MCLKQSLVTNWGCTEIKPILALPPDCAVAKLVALAFMCCIVCSMLAIKGLPLFSLSVFVRFVEARFHAHLQPLQCPAGYSLGTTETGLPMGPRQPSPGDHSCSPYPTPMRRLLWHSLGSSQHYNSLSMFSPHPRHIRRVDASTCPFPEKHSKWKWLGFMNGQLRLKEHPFFRVVSLVTLFKGFCNREEEILINPTVG